MVRDRNVIVRTLLVIGTITAIVGLVYINYQFSRRVPGGNNLLNRWVGARKWLLEGIQPYDQRVSLEAQMMIYGRPSDISVGEDSGDFLYPLPVMVFIAPFGLFSFPVARALWMTVSQLLMPVLTIQSMRIADWKQNGVWRFTLILFSLLWYPALRSVIIGQFSIVEAVLIAGAILGMKKGDDRVAGVFIGLSIVKPQMPFLIIPFLLLWSLSQRRFQLIYWTLGTIVALVGVFMLLLPEWPILWLRQVISYPIYTEVGSPAEIIAQFVPGAEKILEYGISGVLIIYMLWEWYIALNKPVRWAVWTSAMTLVITNLIAFRTATANFVVLLPALVLALGAIKDRWDRWGSISVAVLLLGSLIGGWTLFLLTVEGNTESPLMYLPLPMMLFILLLWTRWWTVRRAKLLALSL